jgi:hypothetical protein
VIATSPFFNDVISSTGFFVGIFGGMKDILYICSEITGITKKRITIMKERFRMMRVAILMICGMTAGLTSCTGSL